jgi:hypothetical protein
VVAVVLTASGWAWRADTRFHVVLWLAVAVAAGLGFWLLRPAVGVRRASVAVLSLAPLAVGFTYFVSLPAITLSSTLTMPFALARQLIVLSAVWVAGVAVSPWLSARQARHRLAAAVLMPAGFVWYWADLGDDPGVFTVELILALVAVVAAGVLRAPRVPVAGTVPAFSEPASPAEPADRSAPSLPSDADSDRPEDASPVW